MNRDDPMEHPDRDEMVMAIDFESEHYQQMREDLVDEIKDDVQSGEVAKQEIFGMFVDANILTNQMQVHIQQLYRNLTTLAIALTLIGSVLLYESYTGSNLLFGIWGGLSFSLAIITFRSTPPGTLRETLWEYYESIFDGVQSVLPS